MVLIVGASDRMQTAQGPRHVPRRNVTWSSFRQTKGAPANTPDLIVAYDRCSGGVLGYQTRYSSQTTYGPPPQD